MQDLLEPIICDNFFDDPDAVRQFALTAVNYYPSSIHMTKGNWPGKRSYFLPWINNNIFNTFTVKLLKLLQLPADTPVFFDVTFNYCTRHDPKGVVHKDHAWSKPDHVGVVYLTPNPAPDSGSILYSPTDQLLRFGSGPDYHDPRNHTIKRKLDNAYNRLVLYDPREYHNADQYFGDSLENARLFIVFFMRIGDMGYQGIRQFDFPHSSPSLNVSLPWFDNPKRKDFCTCGSGKRFKSCCGDMSMERSPPESFLHIRNAFDTVQIKKQLSSALQKPGAQDNPEQPPVADSRFSHVAQVELKTDEQSRLNQFFAELCQKVIEQPIHCDIEWIEQAGIQHFTAGGFRQLHADAEIYNPQSGFCERVLNRDLSLLALPYDLPTGVSLHFPFFNYHCQARAGDLLAFPSDQRFRYELKAPENQDLYMLACWAAKAGPTKTETLPAGATRISR